MTLNVEIVHPYMPSREDMKEGILYISHEYEVAIHICPCGCKEQSVTPFTSQHGWGLSVHDNKATLTPSILNYTCNAHYYITDSEVRWC